MRPEGQDGILVVNKPRGMTSHDVVQLLRQKLEARRIGHAGTLDPLAEGVLVLLVGSAVKHQRDIQAHRKRYEALIGLGTQTDTGDAWGRAVARAPIPLLDERTVKACLSSFVGILEQVPPAFSAVKVHGRPLYWWARHGTKLTARPRAVELFAIELLGLRDDALRVRLDCSSGTYVRSLAEAVASRLGTVGHVRELVRLAVGPWDLSCARDLLWLKAASAEEIRAALQPISAIPIPAQSTAS